MGNDTLDITGAIQTAMSIEVLWAVSEFYGILELLALAGYEVNHWQGEENWAIASIDGVQGAYIWRLYPIIFLSNASHASLPKSLKEDNNIIWVEVEDFTTPTLSFRYELFKNMFPFYSDPDKFSVNDFWFHTVN